MAIVAAILLSTGLAFAFVGMGSDACCAAPTEACCATTAQAESTCCGEPCAPEDCPVPCCEQ